VVQMLHTALEKSPNHLGRWILPCILSHECQCHCIGSPTYCTIWVGGYWVVFFTQNCQCHLFTLNHLGQWILPYVRLNKLFVPFVRPPIEPSGPVDTTTCHSSAVVPEPH
jgi:hypothetical protein